MPLNKETKPNQPCTEIQEREKRAKDGMCVWEREREKESKEDRQRHTYRHRKGGRKERNEGSNKNGGKRMLFEGMGSNIFKK